MLEFLNFVINPRGRISRKTFWILGVAPFVGIAVVSSVADMIVFPHAPLIMDRGPASLVADILLAWPQAAVCIKRFHDRGLSGWLLAGLNLAMAVCAAIGVTHESVPALAAAFLLAAITCGILGAAPGMRRPNGFGGDPLTGPGYSPAVMAAFGAAASTPAPSA